MIKDIMATKEFRKHGGNRPKYYEYVLKSGTIEGLWLEFGVWTGRTLGELCKYAPEIVYGFDSFRGLPEDWIVNFKKGHFNLDNGTEQKDNLQHKYKKARIVIGWFEDTLPEFVKSHPEQCAVIHIDSDLYSSAKTVLDNLKNQIVPGTILLFDEIYGYDGYEEHEMKAMKEFMAETSYECEWLAHVKNGGQSACRIL